MLEPLIYAAMMHNGKPKTVAEFERAAANVADMLQRRAEVTHNKPVASIYISDDGSREFDDWRVDLPPGNHQLFTAPRPDQPQPESLPHPGAPEAEEMIEKLLAEYGYPANMKNAARAGYMAARRLIGWARKPLPDVQAPPALAPAPTVEDLMTKIQAFGLACYQHESGAEQISMQDEIRIDLAALAASQVVDSGCDIKISAPAIPAPEGGPNPMVPLSAIRPIAVEAIRAVTGCPDIKGNEGRYLVDELESVATAAALAAQPQPAEPVAPYLATSAGLLVDGRAFADTNRWAVTDQWVSGWNALRAALAAQPQAPADHERVLDEVLKERDAASDYIDALLDEVLGADRHEWTSNYGHADAMEEVRERMSTLLQPMADRAWNRFEAAIQSPAEAHGDVLVPLTLLEDASSALGNFVSDHGWSDEDMQAMDNLDAFIAQHKANAAAHVEPKGTPVAWEYELLSQWDGEPGANWHKEVSHFQPHDPESRSEIRNLRPLYAAPVPAPAPAPDLYVGLIERLMTLSTRLGIAYEGGVEHFGASLEDRLYAICRSTERLLDSLSAIPSPAVRTEPLSPDQLQTLWSPYAGAAPFSYARAIERAHGIGTGTGVQQATAVAPSPAASDVLAERQRQIEREGYTRQFDADMHDSNDLARAAAFYAMAEVGYEYGRVAWPWDEEGCKVKDRYRNFVRAAALLIAAADVERARSGVSDVPVHQLRATQAPAVGAES